MFERIPGYDVHHIFAGANRKKSEKYGAIVQVPREMHRQYHETTEGRERWQEIKAIHQHRIMKEQGWDLDRWIQEFGRSWI